MGAIDEHWCSDCKRTLSKQKDQYLDLESIRLDFPSKKGILCHGCLQKPEYEGLRKLLGAGNPDFRPFIECALHTICETFKAVTSRPVRCAHIAVVGDTVYCKRRHPGAVKLPVERAERLRLERKLLMGTMRRVFKQLPPDISAATMSMLEQGLKGTWVPPSGVVKAIPRPNKDGEEQVCHP